MIENAQRQDVNGWDMAQRLKMLLDNDIGKQEICKHIGKSITWVNDVLKVLEADPEVQKQVKKGGISLDEAKKTAKLPPAAQKTVAKGLAAAKKSGDKKTTRAIKKGIDQATRVRSNVMPSKKEIKKNKNILGAVLPLMKSDKDTFETDEWFILNGCYNMLRYVLGEMNPPNFEKHAQQYGLKLAKDGTKAKEKKKASGKKKKKKKDKKK